MAEKEPLQDITVEISTEILELWRNEQVRNFLFEKKYFEELATVVTVIARSLKEGNRADAIARKTNLYTPFSSKERNLPCSVLVNEGVLKFIDSAVLRFGGDFEKRIAVLKNLVDCFRNSMIQRISGEYAQRILEVRRTVKK